MNAEEMSLEEWVRTEIERRTRMEDPDAPVELRPLKDFSDEYADPTEYIPARPHARG